WTGPSQSKDSPQNQVVAAYKERLHFIEPAALGAASRRLPLFPEGVDIRAIAAYGHTPGHTVYLVESKGKQLLIWADLTHAMAVQMPFPQVAVTYDVDPAQAVVARKAVLAYVAANKIPVAGMHIAHPSMGTVSAAPGAEGGYTFTPLPTPEK
ncbi:MAG: hypothetical protein LBV54_06300, partial [Puniceicoccales bacterium]|nr:hypothetical protein [Puniceicoccales bacterium]